MGNQRFSTGFRDEVALQVRDRWYSVKEASERLAAPGTLALAFLLRIAYAFHYRVGTDEPQHLHVVWGWAQGLVSHRDFFDNHAPLFHILCAPLLSLVGERADVVIVMRLAMFPLYALSLWGIYRIGRRIFTPWVARWGTIAAALVPCFFFGSLEFRTDDLWSALWILTLAVLIQPGLSRLRWFLAGTLLGTALGVSMKTVLMLASLAGAGGTVLILARSRGASPASRALAGRIALFLAGFAVVPVLLVALYARLGGLGALYEDTIGFNLLPGLWGRGTAWRVLLFPLATVLLAWGARVILRMRGPVSRCWPELVVFLANGIYLALLHSFWPLLTRQDFLPVAPVIALFATGAVAELRARVRWPVGRRWLARAPALTAVAMAGVMVATVPPWENRVLPQTRLLEQVLSLTGPGDWVADAKGETIFRRRSDYYVLEGITKERFKRGLLPDDIPERLLRTDTRVVVPFGGPARGQLFVQKNFVRVGEVAVAGQLLGRSRKKKSCAPGIFRFVVRIPARYTVVNAQGILPGRLDGKPLRRSRFLQAGLHVFRSEGPARRAYLLWALAVERGFSPFSKPGPA